MQRLVVCSDQVAWAKQGMCTLVDGEPEPPTLKDFTAPEGWKLVKNFVASSGGGDYQFPKDQILLVAKGVYKVMDSPEDRELGSLSASKSYLVWYHHLLPEVAWSAKRKKYSSS